MPRIKRHQAILMRGATYAIGAMSWLRAPLKVDIPPGMWEVLRANPGLKLAANGNFRLVPR